ncbi:MAG: hypothetical protein Tsb0020_01720 [Haliangiales bacterium]
MLFTQPKDPQLQRAASELAHPPLRVLHIEDDPGYARLVGEYLKDSELSAYLLSTVTTLGAAVDEIARELPDVVITDLGLPDVGADEVVPTLRDASPRIPIVVLSGQRDIDKALESIQQGAQEFLVKGRSEDFFLARSIRAAIERKRFEEFEQLLVGVVSHDMRSPLHALTGIIDILAREHDIAELGELARSALQQACSLTEDLLDFTSLRLHGLLPIDKRDSDLATCVQSVIDGARLATSSRTIKLELSGATEGQFDAGRMHQVISNLLNNALQHSPDDSPVMVRCLGSRDQLVFEVINRGEPIPADQLSTLFLPLERLHNSGHQRGSLGLGLYITEQIVRTHGGTICVTSTQEEGTLFRVVLPKLTAEDHPSAELAQGA